MSHLKMPTGQVLLVSIIVAVSTVFLKHCHLLSTILRSPLLAVARDPILQKHLLLQHQSVEERHHGSQ